MDEPPVDPTSSSRWGPQWHWPALTFVLGAVVLVMTLLLILGGNDGDQHLAVQVGHSQRDGSSTSSSASTASSTPASLAAAEVTTSGPVLTGGSSISTSSSSSPSTTGTTAHVNPSPSPSTSTPSTSTPSTTTPPTTTPPTTTPNTPRVLTLADNGHTIHLHSNDVFYVDLPVASLTGCPTLAVGSDFCDFYLDQNDSLLVLEDATVDHALSQGLVRIKFQVVGSGSSILSLKHYIDADFDFTTDVLFTITTN